MKTEEQLHQEHLAHQQDQLRREQRYLSRRRWMSIKLSATAGVCGLISFAGLGLVFSGGGVVQLLGLLAGAVGGGLLGKVNGGVGLGVVCVAGSLFLALAVAIATGLLVLAVGNVLVGFGQVMVLVCTIGFWPVLGICLGLWNDAFDDAHIQM